MPKISIIVPVYNTEQYLPRCIDSICAQTFTDFELLLIDDGSKDCSGKICDEYATKDSRIKVYHKANEGANAARRTGVTNAYGEWIAFVDSDDYISPNALELLQNKASNTYDIVIANTKFNETISNQEYIRRLLECKIRCECWGTLFRHSLVKSSIEKIPSSIIIGEDFLMNILCAKMVSKVLLIDDNIYYYNNRPHSLVNSYEITTEHEKEVIYLLEEFIKESRDIYSFSIFRKKYLTIERLVYNGENPYNETWVKNVMHEKEKYYNMLGIKEKILLTFPYSRINRLILKLGIFIKGILRLE